MMEEATLFRQLSKQPESKNVSSRDDNDKHKSKSKKHKTKRQDKNQRKRTLDIDAGTNQPKNVDDSEGNSNNLDEVTDTADSTQQRPQLDDKKRQRAERKARKQELMAQLPKVDADGISFTKQQVRRMLKRVQKGLAPIPTPQEAHDLRVHEAQLRKQEELELADMLYDRTSEGRQKQESEEDNEQEEPHDDDVPLKDKSEGPADDDDDDQDHHNKTAPPPSKRAKLSNTSSSGSKKPVPHDYICQACHNKHQPAHWIYNCPDKVTVRGTNHVSAGKRQPHDGMPSAKKVFVSGLPFDATPKSVRLLFEQEPTDKSQTKIKVTSVQLLKFTDTGRCKGQAFVCFDTEAAAKCALQRSGTKIPVQASTEDSKKSKTNDAPETTTAAAAKPSKKELVLKVTKVQSRFITKQRKHQTPQHT